MSDLFENIVGNLDGEPTEFSRINHPLIKLLLTILPLLLGAVILLLRQSEIHVRPNLLLFSLLIILTCQKLDFRPASEAQNRFWLGILISAIIVLMLIQFSVLNFQDITSILPGVSERIKYFEKYLTIEDAIIFSFFIVAIKGAKLFTAPDVLWLARFLLFKNLQVIFIVIIFTFFVIQGTFTSRLHLAWTTAQNKMVLLRRKNNFVTAMSQASKIYFQKLLFGFFETAKLTQSILKERGFYKKVARNHLNFKKTAEDQASIYILIFSFLFCLLYYFK